MTLRKILRLYNSSGDFSPANGGIKMTATKKATQIESCLSHFLKKSRFKALKVLILLHFYFHFRCPTVFKKVFYKIIYAILKPFNNNKSVFLDSFYHKSQI